MSAAAQSVDLTLAKSAVIVLAGGAAGFINSIVGSGTLISFPTLVGLGFAERAANIANGTGLFPGSMSAVAAQRPELAGQRSRLVRLLPASMLGGITGAILLLTLPGSWFKRIVPFLILFGVGLVVAGPTIQRKLRERNGSSTIEGNPGAERIGPFNERPPIDSRLRLDHVDGRSRPRIDHRRHSHRSSSARESEARPHPARRRA